MQSMAYENFMSFLDNTTAELLMAFNKLFARIKHEALTTNERETQREKTSGLLI